MIGTGSDGQVRVWKSELGRELTGLDLRDVSKRQLEEKGRGKNSSHSEFAIASVAFSPDRCLIATASVTGKVDIIW